MKDGNIQNRLIRSSVKDFLVHFQEKYNEFYNSDRLDDILDQGRDKAQKAFKTLEKMERAMGLGRKR